MDRTEAIVSLMPLVSQLARKAQRQVPQFALDDLVSEGMIGAIQAVDRYDECDVPLPAYAYRRIRGQIWDHVRDYGGLSRNHYAAVKEGEEQFFVNSLDAPISTGSRDSDGMMLADLLPDDEDAIARMVDELAIRAVMSQVPEKFQDLLQAYHYAGLSMKQIGELRGVTEGRVSQLLNEAHDWAYHYLMA